MHLRTLLILLNHKNTHSQVLVPISDCSIPVQTEAFLWLVIYSLSLSLSLVYTHTNQRWVTIIAPSVSHTKNLFHTHTYTNTHLHSAAVCAQIQCPTAREDIKHTVLTAQSLNRSMQNPLYTCGRWTRICRLQSWSQQNFISRLHTNNQWGYCHIIKSTWSKSLRHILYNRCYQFIARSIDSVHLLRAGEASSALRNTRLLLPECDCLPTASYHGEQMPSEYWNCTSVHDMTAFACSATRWPLTEVAKDTVKHAEEIMNRKNGGKKVEHSGGMFLCQTFFYIYKQ